MKPIQNIVVGYDFSDPSRQALLKALTLAEVFGATLHVVHAIAPEIATPFVPKVVADLQNTLQQGLDNQVREFVAKSGKGAPVASVRVLQGLPYACLIERAEEVGAELILVGSHSRRWLGQVLLGSQAIKTVRYSPVPVFVHHAYEERAVKTILVPIDESDISELAIPEALMLAKAFGATVQLAHAVALPPYESVIDVQALAGEMSKAAEKRLAALAQKHQLNTPPIVRQGPPAAVLASLIHENKNIGLVVLATHGHTGLNHFLLGSVAESVVRHSVCPVVTLHGQERGAKLRKAFKSGILWD